jgi:hypothetical protein
LPNKEDDKIEEDVFRRQNEASEDYHRLERRDCLKFGEELLNKITKVLALRGNEQDPTPILRCQDRLAVGCVSETTWKTEGPWRE